MATIDLSNYDSTTLGLVQCTGGGRAGTPNGNVYFDLTNGLVELITQEELANVDMNKPTLGRSGAASVANPLTNQDGVKMEALYAFEREQRRLDETLRQYDYFFKGTFKYGGAYECVNGRKFAVDTNLGAPGGNHGDRVKLRGSGHIERNSAGAIGRIYYGVRSLGNIEALSQPYYQLVDYTTNAPVDFAKDGPIDEVIQVYGDVGVDATTTTFDDRTFLSVKVRTYGNNYDEKDLAASGVTEMGGYASGFALSESTHNTTNTTDHPLASVYNATQASQTGVWLNMVLEGVSAAETKTGFTTADAPFTYILRNPNGANLNECLAYLDAIAQTDDNINDTGTNGVTINGKRADVWYEYDAAGNVIPKCGVYGAASYKDGAPQPGDGLFIEGLTGTDKNRVIFYDDNGAQKVYPNYTTVQVTVSSDAVADTKAWIHAFFLDGPGAGDDFNTSGALTVQTPDATEVKGDLSSMTTVTSNQLYRTADRVDFTFDWYSDTIGGPIETDKWVVFECEGDAAGQSAGVTAAKQLIQLVDAPTITASCIPPAENNI